MILGSLRVRHTKLDLTFQLVVTCRKVKTYRLGSWSFPRSAPVCRVFACANHLAPSLLLPSLCTLAFSFFFFSISWCLLLVSGLLNQACHPITRSWYLIWAISSIKTREEREWYSRKRMGFRFRWGALGQFESHPHHLLNAKIWHINFLCFIFIFLGFIILLS